MVAEKRNWKDGELGWTLCKGGGRRVLGVRRVMCGIRFVEESESRKKLSEVQKVDRIREIYVCVAVKPILIFLRIRTKIKVVA